MPPWHKWAHAPKQEPPEHLESSILHLEILKNSLLSKPFFKFASIYEDNKPIASF